MTETGKNSAAALADSPESLQSLAGKRTLAQKLGDWLARDREEKDVDLAKLMRANILISFLSLMLVAGDETALSLWLMLGL
jgi:hypothetical protein